MKRGIIQSRGLGDILIALPIARYYHLQGDEIVWPISSEFYYSLVKSVPWVEWIGMDADPEGKFFLETPLRIFKERGIDPDEALYLYHYLSNVPELTDPEMFNILKFDQYKYQYAGVPFRNKWQLSECITRDLNREHALQERLNISGRYAVCHLTGSTAQVDSKIINWLDPAVRLINIDDFKTDSIFDWLGVIRGAEAFIGLDSVFTNLVDQLNIQGPELYWIRRSPWDLTPVLGNTWTIVPTNLPIVEPKRVDPAALAADKAGKIAASQPKAASKSNSLESYVPFETNKTHFPTSFMSALK